MSSSADVHWSNGKDRPPIAVEVSTQSTCVTLRFRRAADEVESLTLFLHREDAARLFGHLRQLPDDLEHHGPASEARDIWSRSTANPPEPAPAAPTAADFAMRACRTLVQAYEDGYAKGGETDWDDIARAHSWAIRALAVAAAKK